MKISTKKSIKECVHQEILPTQNKNFAVEAMDAEVAAIFNVKDEESIKALAKEILSDIPVVAEVAENTPFGSFTGEVTGEDVISVLPLSELMEFKFNIDAVNHRPQFSFKLKYPDVVVFVSDKWGEDFEAHVVIEGEYKLEALISGEVNVIKAEHEVKKIDVLGLPAVEAVDDVYAEVEENQVINDDALLSSQAQHFIEAYPDFADLLSRFELNFNVEPNEDLNRNKALHDFVEDETYPNFLLTEISEPADNEEDEDFTGEITKSDVDELSISDAIYFLKDDVVYLKLNVTIKGTTTLYGGKYHTADYYGESYWDAKDFDFEQTGPLAINVAAYINDEVDVLEDEEVYQLQLNA